MPQFNLVTRCVAAVLLTAALGACSSDDPKEPAPPAPAPNMPGDTFALTSTSRLVSFNRASPVLRTGIAITGLQSGERLHGIDIRPGGTPAGEIYGLSSLGRLYVISSATGVATLKSTLAADPTDATTPFLALDGSDFGVDFNPVVDRLRVVSNTGQNLRINVDTGATISDGALNSAGATSTGLSSAAYTNSFAAACRTALFFLDSGSDRLFTTSDPNGGAVSVVGALGADVGSGAGFEIVTASDGSNAALTSVTMSGVPALYSIALGTGATTLVGSITGLNSGETLIGLTAAAPATAPVQTAGNALGITASNRLISFNTAAPQKLCTTAPVSGLQSGETLLGIDARPADGVAYALASTGRLYTLDPASGAATLKSTLTADLTDISSPFNALEGTDFGLDFNPVPDRLRVVSSSGQNLRINVDTGATTTDTTLNPTGSSVTAAAYTNAFAGADSTTLYGIDSTGERLIIQGQPSGNPNAGDLLGAGALGVGDVQAVAGFDIDGRNNNAFAALGLAGAATSDLYTLNLATGAATRVNTIGGGEAVKGLTIASPARARVYGVTADARLVSFRVATPGTFESDVPIAGIAGETIVGADFRPASGALFAVTDAGRTYRIDIATGAATSISTLAADTADMTVPFTMLTGTAFGVDFNPTVDRLRIVSDSGLNLRTNIDSGATITDTVLARSPVAVTGAAYTNSSIGALSTTLYVVDSRNDRLMTQSPPNDGTLNDAGGLGIDAQSVSGFEISGPDTAFAALSTSANPAGFFSVNLATGAATLVGDIALPASTDRVTGIAALPSLVTPAAGSSVYALVNGVTLIAFARNAPGTLVLQTGITGMQSGESALGMDFRPADGLLYALGSTGRLYTIDTASGAATLTSALAADPADLSAPFPGLDGMDFGVDFNPVADRLRVVSNNGQNLRINVATGATTTDGALNVPAPLVIAAAYTQNFAGAAATRLFGIDAATLALQLQSPPNDGTLVTVGRLDPALIVGTGIAFDIAGGDDGLSLVSMTPVGATQSTLYRVNLRTGAATAVGPIGAPTAQPLRALAIQMQ